MCGIVGYTGGHQAQPILVAGLAASRVSRIRQRREWPRSTAINSCVRKRAGRVRVLEELLEREPAPGTCGISHTRWATHGPATDRNAHPHLGGRAGAATVAVVHNGVIENHASLRRELESQGFVFVSQTDTEVVAHLIARELESADDLFEAVQRALAAAGGNLRAGRRQPEAARRGRRRRFGSPLVVGLGDGEHLLASDPIAIAPHTARVAFLQDGEVVRLTPRDFEIRHLEHGPITPRIDRIDWKPDAVELGGHAHYMLKEIREQPDTVIDACRGRLRQGRGDRPVRRPEHHGRQLRRVRRIVFAACGTSWHAALVGEYLIERLAHLPVEVEYRQRIPLPQRPARRTDAGLRPQPVRRNRRHAGRLARGQTPRPPRRWPS